MIKGLQAALGKNVNTARKYEIKPKANVEEFSLIMLRTFLINARTILAFMSVMKADSVIAVNQSTSVNEFDGVVAENRL